MSQRAIPACLMRGGTSKGLYVLKDDLPADTAVRDRVLLAALGSPDARQIDGVGGAHPLTSKVAVVSKSDRPDADIDYLFLQIFPDKAIVTDQQNCGNILAGVGPFAIERGLVAAAGEVTEVRIHMINTASIAVAAIETPGGQVNYEGSARIDGVPGSHAPIMLNFLDVAGSSCGALLPTGNAADEIDGIAVTLIDNGMPVVVMQAADFGLSGAETPDEIEANADVRARVEAIRLKAGPLMNLGDVTKASVPKMTLISPARNGGDVSTRTFIPHRVHDAIGVLGAVSVATALALKDGITGSKTFEIEHPTGFFSVEMEIEGAGETLKVTRSALLRTARMLMRGEVLVPASIWPEVGA
ncbi:prpF family protein [Asticcacaulis biprosthecium C19]|uniref:PrpF family protein n=1 Tax=Asticcacaulis biprosthecium C19 TaxID=715226 RepID=F4QNZ8_9CAUL|nr:4-oxalomesaconate tautomerase [Asticcacaulis biprosthecium]EGF91056.1 prpF family protein [Asticcacaulis biprosthecium C19]